MKLLQLSLRSLRQRLFSSVLTSISVAVAVGLLAAIMQLQTQTKAHFDASIEGYRAIIGPKDGSQLELTLNTVFHFGQSQGLVRLEVYKDLRAGRVGRNTQALYAIPQSRGDSYGQDAFPIIGTTDEMFSRFQIDRDRKGLLLAEGEPWSFGHDDLMAFAAARAAHENRNRASDGEWEVFTAPEEWRRIVVGAEVARKLGLSLGDEIVPIHGKAGMPGAHPHPQDACELVGILAPTGTAVDRALWVPMGAQLSISDHFPFPQDLEREFAADDLLISAVVVKPIHHMGPMNLRKAYQTRSDAQVSFPADEVVRLFALVGDIAGVLQLVSWMVLVVGGIGIAVSIYNTMEERRREMAIYRCLGARRWHIALIVVQEAVVIAGLGAALGLLAAHGAAALAVDMVQARAGVRIDPFQVLPEEGWLLLGTVGLGAIAGLIPAAKGMATEVARYLAPTS